MEERDPPASHLKEEEQLGTLNTETPDDQPHLHDTFRSGTYLVQVPKDQIYRVPPPENAAYLHQRFGNNQTQQKKSLFCHCLAYTLLVLVLLALLLLIILGIFYLVVKPKHLNFSVDHVLVNHHQNPKLKYEITLNAENPNQRLDFFYLTGGHASLSFKQHKIAIGKPPAVITTPSLKSTRVQLVLSGSNGKLPRRVQKSLKGKGKKKESIALSLLVHIPVRLKIGPMNTWSMKMAVSCNLRVDTLDKSTRVLSRECYSDVQVF